MDNFKSLMIGEKAPPFKASATTGPINFPDDFKGKWVVFFSHPGDFTPVCTTEMMTFGSMKDEFASHNINLVGLSVDSNPSHIEWARSMEKYQWNNIKNPKINFPIIADDLGSIARMYGMLMPTASATRTVRSVFVIDPEGTIRAILIYPLTTGRNMNEILRLVLALQSFDATGNPTPADWMPGDVSVFAAPQTMTDAQKRLDDQHTNGSYCLDWYICFTKGTKPANMPSAPVITPISVGSVLSTSGNMPTIAGAMSPASGVMSPTSGAMPPAFGAIPPAAGNIKEKTMGENINQNMKNMNSPESNTSMMNQSVQGMMQKSASVSRGMSNMQPPDQRNKVFTVNELSRFNGKMGMPAYIAVNGVVYDLGPVANIPTHLVSYAGTDISNEYNSGQMGISYFINRLPIVGILKNSETVGLSPSASQNMISSINDFLITRDYPQM